MYHMYNLKKTYFQKCRENQSDFYLFCKCRLSATLIQQLCSVVFLNILRILENQLEACDNLYFANITISVVYKIIYRDQINSRNGAKICYPPNITTHLNQHKQKDLRINRWSFESTKSHWILHRNWNIYLFMSSCIKQNQSNGKRKQF